MKIGTLLSLALATVGLFAMASPAEAQHHGGSGGFTGHGGGNYHGGNYYHGGHYYGRSHVNFYFGGLGYPYYYGDPFLGSPYGYAYGYAPYGYGYGYNGYSAPVAAYTYDPQHIYTGRVVSRDSHQLSVAAQVQQQLAQAGYYRGEIDGVIGDGTRRAIRTYERANGLRVDGRIDNELLSSMGLG